MLINLLINAIEASEGKNDRKILVTAYRNQMAKPVFAVLDNGLGISEEIRENIFVPFFSTKNRGSGVGLSLSKQIMTLHKGKISLRNRKEGGTEAQLIFS